MAHAKLILLKNFLSAAVEAVAYDYTKKGLLRPETYPVFVGLDRAGPFDPGDTGLSPNNAWWLMSLCQLSYFDQPDIARELPKVGLELRRFLSDEGRVGATGTQAFLAEGPGHVVLAFRGTEADRREDTIADLQFRTVPLDGGPRVHRGFLAALDGVWPHLAPELERVEATGKPLFFTGHSLGAGLATLAAARHRPAALQTFGSPRVGRGGLAALLAGVPHHRFVNCSDLVTRVPPAWVGYRHVGRRQFFDHEGRLLSEPSDWTVGVARFRAAVAYRKLRPLHHGWLPARNLADHAPLNYLESLRRAVG